MSVNTKDLEAAISKVMKSAGYQKNGNYWYFETSECISLLELQKSQWGGQHYINLGGFVKSLSTIKLPKEYQCHIRGRLSGIVPDKVQFENLLNLEDTSPSLEGKLNEITVAIKEYALPMLSSFQSLYRIKEALQNGDLRNFLVSVRVRDLLEHNA